MNLAKCSVIAALCWLSGAAHADGVKIHVQDLDLKSPEGVAILYQRIGKAALEYCGAGRYETGSRIPHSADSACVSDAISHTVAALNIPALTELDARKRAR